MTTFAIATLGCKVNTFESQGYALGLQTLGYDEVSFKDKADIYLINTCAVTNTAASKSRQKIHQAEALNAQALIVVIGCYVQTASEQLKQDPHIDLLIGSDQKEDIPRLVQEALEKGIQHHVMKDMRKASVFEALPVMKFTHQTRAYLKVQDGCNQFCSYCIIPYARGAERSLHPDEVIAQGKALVAHGHLEIVLTGIHTGRYGKEYDTTLSDILKRMCLEIEGLQRIRISSIEMNEISDALIKLMQEEPKIARHLHIPIQSANNQVLLNMHRPYTVEEYHARIQEIRQQLPNISISSDVIVGFPQESEEEFQNTLQNIEAMQLSFLHVFPFSKRDGTKAASLPNQWDNKTKKERSNRLMKQSEQLYDTYKQSFLGKNVRVIWEKQVGHQMVGHTSEYIEVYGPYLADKLHQIEDVQVEAFQDHVLMCKAHGR